MTLTTDQIKQIYALRRSLPTPTNLQISEKLNIKLPTVKYWIKRYNRAGTKLPAHKAGRTKLEVGGM